MATTQTLRPNATVLNTFSVWTGSGVGAANTAHAELSDNDDQSGIEGTGGPGVTCELDYTTYALQANERCLRVRVKALGHASDDTPDDAYLDHSLKSGGVIGGTLTVLDDGIAAPHMHTGPWTTSPPDVGGGEWLQAKIDALRTYSEHSGGATNSPYVTARELYVELDIHLKPSATISSPTLDQVMPSLPVSVGWAYSGDGDVQKKYLMRVFTAAVAEGGGFNVDTSPNVYNSGEVSGSTASASIPSGITYGGQYYVYVKVAKDFNGADWWSDWSAGRRFKVNARPTVTVTAPSGVVADTNRPTVTWGYADDDGDPQTHYRVRIFEQPGGTWVGFDPDVATAYWASGEVASSAGSVQVPSTHALPNLKTWRAYVKVKQSTPSVIESLWYYSDFTTDFAASAVPSVSALAFEDKIEVTVTPGTPIVPAADWIDVERSLDGGVTWAPFRYGGLLLSTDFSPADPFTITDYEVPLGEEVQYRAYSVTTASGQEVASEPSAVANATPTGKKVWLKDPSDGALGQHFIIEDKWLSMSKRRGRTIVQPLGRSKPVVIRGSGDGVSFALTVVVLGEEDHDALMTLLESDRTLFVQTPKGNWYAEVAENIEDIAHLWDDLHNEEDVWRVTIPFVEVDF